MHVPDTAQYVRRIGDKSAADRRFGSQWRKRRSPSTQRGSLVVVAIIALVVLTIMGLALMDGANATFQQGRRQPRLTSLRALADGGAQYGYWQYTYNSQSLPYTSGKVSVGTPGYFIVTVTDNSANISSTIQVVSTAYIYSDTYTVTRVYSKGGGSGGGSAPSAPTNLVATANVGSIGLTWTSVSGATSYSIYRGTSSGGESATPIATGITTASYTDSSAVVGTTYYYYVTATNSSGTSSDSNQASATETQAGYVTVTPSVPSLSDYYGNEQLEITSTQTITSMTVTMSVIETAGLTYDSEWDSYAYVTQSYSSNGSVLTYTSVLTNGDTQASGSNNVDDSFNLNGTAHSVTGDTYTVQVTAGGVSQTITGQF